MAKVFWWAGGSGAFIDPNFYLDPGSDQGPFGPPGPSDLIDYLNPGTVLFSGNSTGVAYINAVMVFDLSGGGFTLDPTANLLAALAFDSNTIPEDPVDSLTVTGKNTLSTPEITIGNLPVTLTITNGATVAVSGQVVGLETGTQLSVTDNGDFVVKGGALNIVPDVFATGAVTTLVAERGTISAQSIGITAEQLSITGNSVLNASGNTMFPTIGGAIDLTLDAAAATALIQDSSLTASGATGSISVTGPMITLAGADDFAAHSTTVHGTTSLVVSSGAAVKVAGGLAISAPTATVNTGATVIVTGALQLAGGAVTTTGATTNVGSTITIGADTSLTVSQSSTVLAADIIEIGLLTINASSVTTNTMEIAQAAGAPIDNVHVQNGRLTVSGTLTVGGGVTAVPMPFGGLDADVAARITAGSVDIGAGGATNLEGNIGLDTNAILTVTKDLVVGDTSTGDLLVHSGATIVQTGGTVDLGAKATGVGTLTLDHAGASANFSGSTTVGDAGQGTINLSNSAMLQTTGVSVGSQANAMGAVNVDGDSTVWDASDDVTIGASGTGSLGITNGGAANLSGKLNLAADEGSHATVTLNGASSDLTVADLMTIGGAGLATVNVQLGATLNAQDVLLGQAMAPAGGAIDPDTGLHLTNVDVVNINGGGAINARMLTVGEAGYGALIFAGGVVVAEGAAILADQANSEAQIIVDGTASSLTTDDLTVAQSGKARLTVGSLNTVVTHGNAVMAAVKGSQATVILGDDTEQTPGSGHANWTIDAALTVGEGGGATLLSNASTLDVGGSTFTIGDAQGSNGLLTMNASQLLFGGHLVIGNQGKGKLLFQEGSTSTVGAGVATPAIIVGAQTGGTGSLIVTGTGTRLQANELQVGAFGKGAAQVTGGAELEVSGPVAVATQEEGIIQVLTVSGPSELSVGSELAVGELGVGALQVMSGATVAVGGNVSIGESKAASGIATITGSDTTAGKPSPSSLNWGGTLIVGDLGLGTLLVENGASVMPSKGGGGAIEMGAEIGGSGTITVRDAGSVLQAATLDIGGTQSGKGGAGILTVMTGGVVHVSDLTVWSSGHVKLAGGKLQTDPITINGGEISGDGTVTGVITDDGTITATGGTLDVTDDVSGAGVLAIGAGGTLELDGTDHGVDVNFVSGGVGQTLRLATVGNLQAAISGFVAGYTVAVGNLVGASSTFSSTGTEAFLTFTNGATDLGTLSFLGSYTQQDLAFNGATGTVGTAVPCFAAGTLIETPDGAKAVEDLRPGAQVRTLSGRLRVVQWIGHRRVDCRRHPLLHTVWPIRIQVGAFGHGRPGRTLFLSPDHAVFVEDVLIPIKYLTNGTTVRQMKVASVTYYHIELPQHDIVLAEGLPTESFLDTGNRAAFANGGGVTQIHPDFRQPPDTNCLMWEAFHYAPLTVVGEQVERVRRTLRMQSKMLRRARECPEWIPNERRAKPDVRLR